MSASHREFRVVEQPLELAPLIAAVSDDGHGAVVSFLGVVRDHGEAGAVGGLAYSAYPEMAEKKMAEIGDEMAERFGPLSVAALHRVGRLAIGEASLALAVGAAHRKEAYAAAIYFVDRLKEIVPIWKEDLPCKEKN
jgi:molybdopterin synthase catalytic subunit